MPLLVVDRVSKRLGSFQLSEVSFQVEEGEYFVVLGPTGAGKTLLLEVVAGFYKPDSGRILLNGNDITSWPPEKRGIGFVYQDYALFPHMSVRENISYGLKVRGASEEEIEEKVRWASELLGVGHLLDRKPEQLSGGEQQRIALARALVLEPKLLLLDEPFSAVDVALKKKLWEELKKIHEELGLAVVHVTHNHEEALFFADRIAVMESGRIVEEGDPLEVFYRPRSLFVAEFLQFGNILRGEAVGFEDGLTAVDVGGVVIKVPGEYRGRVVLGVRPEDVLLSKAPVRSTARNVLKGMVEELSVKVPLVEVSVAVGGSRIKAFVTKASMEELGLRAGDEVYLTFKASSVRVLKHEPS